jgi:hypothetical protein
MRRHESDVGLAARSDLAGTPDNARLRGGWTLGGFDQQLYSYVVPTVIAVWGISTGAAGTVKTEYHRIAICSTRTRPKRSARAPANQPPKRSAPSPS